MKVLVFGASGMLGNAVMRVLSESADLDVYGSVRSGAAKKYFPEAIAAKLITGVDVENHDSLVNVFAEVKPDIIINCVGLIKQLAHANDPLSAIPINSLLPHRLAKLAKLAGARMIHMSTDCVFTGEKGGYTEDDKSDSTDLYGVSKYLGEVKYDHSITLRTSIIGHELGGGSNGLVGWFLSQQGSCKGFTRAIFSGLPTVVLAQVIRDVVIPRPQMSGLYHVAAAPINKHDLITLVAKQYGKTIDIRPDDKLVIDRSLDASRFNSETGYTPPAWEELVRVMHTYYMKQESNNV
ncbi:MAG: SDR family oxidoreductase [Gammaproteobacteria bacterium]|nr:SDR family oxidoreductase [Gammaproteobacteria bacterium]